MAMEYVGFKRGTLAELNALIDTISTTATLDRLKVGFFYLTTDTNRLYVCKENSSNQKELVDLNQSITIVARAEDLPVAPNPIASLGQFYYLRTENVLCVYLTGIGWKQINKDTYLELSGLNVTFSTGTNAVTVTSTVQDSSNHESIGSFTIKGSQNISVEKDSNNNIVISTPPGSDTTYTLGASAGASGSGANITLTDNTATPNTLSLLIIGENNVSVSYDTTNSNIKITGPNLDATNTASFNASGALSVSPTIDGNTGTAISVTPHIKYGKTADATPVQYGTTAVFASGDANLDVYTTGLVDALINRRLQAADAMTYQGTVSTSAQLLALTDVQKGDTYKASGDFKLGSYDVKLGDLIIFNAPDDSTNTASSWDVVPSGDDLEIEVRTNASTNTFMLYEQISGANLGSLVITGDATSHIAATGSVTNNVLTITISQEADYTAQTVAGSTSDVTLADNTNATFTAVTAILTDAYGNVVDGSILTSTFTVKDTHANISSVAVNAENSSTTNVVDVSTKVEDTDGDFRTGSFKLTSSNLTVSAQAGVGINPDTVSINLMWDSF